MVTDRNPHVCGTSQITYALIICAQVDLVGRTQGLRLMFVATSGSCCLCLVQLTLELSLVLLSIGRHQTAIYRGTTTTTASYRRGDRSIQSCYLLQTYHSWPSVGMDPSPLPQMEYPLTGRRHCYSN